MYRHKMLTRVFTVFLAAVVLFDMTGWSGLVTSAETAAANASGTVDGTAESGSEATAQKGNASSNATGNAVTVSMDAELKDAVTGDKKLYYKDRAGFDTPEELFNVRLVSADAEGKYTCKGLDLSHAAASADAVVASNDAESGNIGSWIASPDGSWVYDTNYRYGYSVSFSVDGEGSDDLSEDLHPGVNHIEAAFSTTVSSDAAIKTEENSKTVISNNKDGSKTITSKFDFDLTLHLNAVGADDYTETAVGPDDPEGKQKDKPVTMTVKISNPDADADGYRVYENKDGKLAEIGSSSGDARSYTYDEKTHELNFTGLGLSEKYSVFIAPYYEYDGESKGIYVEGLDEVNDGTLKADKLTYYDLYSKPREVTGLTFDYRNSKQKSAPIYWNAVPNALGYIVKWNKTKTGSGEDTYIYHKVIEGGNNTKFSIPDLEANTNYKVLVEAYVDQKLDGDPKLTGHRSDSNFHVGTNTKETTMKLKNGKNQVRVTWTKVSGADGYQIYSKTNGDYVLLWEQDAKADLKHVITGLPDGVTYTFKVVPYRDYEGNRLYAWDVNESTTKSGGSVNVKATSTKAKLYPKYSKFKKSYAYRAFPWFKKHISKKKSFAIPGLSTTNVAGFSSVDMCPQGLTVAGSYFIISAYDKDDEENSVLYVLTKKYKLKTVIVLPDAMHVGGVTYDGKNLWISHGEQAAYLKYAVIKDAATSGQPYVTLTGYSGIIDLDMQNSYISYNKKKNVLVVGEYHDYTDDIMAIYSITGKSTSSVGLTKRQSFSVYGDVQGVTFDSKGYMIFSRSDINSLVTYKPKWKGKTIKKFNKVKSVHTIPVMSQGVVVYGKYTYVLFESAQYSSAKGQAVDRVCAFKTSKVKKKK